VIKLEHDRSLLAHSQRHSLGINKSPAVEHLHLGHPVGSAEVHGVSMPELTCLSSPTRRVSTSELHRYRARLSPYDVVQEAGQIDAGRQFF
jgi:hypothetical protein